MTSRLEGFDHRHSRKLDFALNAVLGGPMCSVSNTESAFGVPGGACGTVSRVRSRASGSANSLTA
jgi:hypothetical protein